MPVSSETSISGPFTPNGVTTSFAFDFKAASASEVVATDGDGNVISTALYSVTLDDDEGGTLTFGTAPEVSDYPEIYVLSEPELTQPSDFDNAGPSFNPAALTRAIDRAAIRDLKLNRDIGRALKLPFGEAAITFPGVADRANKYLSFLPDGSLLMSSGTGADSGLRDDIASSTGGAMVGLDDGRDLQAYIADQGVYNAGINGVSASATAADNLTALQAAIDHVTSTGGLVLELPPGEILIDGDLIVPPLSGDSPIYSRTLVIRGAGPGENGSWLHFTSGSLRVRTSNHWLRDFRVTSDDADGIVIEPQTAPSNRYPVRSGMENVRAEYCELSGITFADCWIYTIVNCFARFNKVAGIEGKTGSLTNLACNNLNISGGEFQGNGSIAGTPTGGGGSLKGTGAGIITGRCVQFSILNSAIEGNYGDGLVLSEQCRGLTLLSVYFEKNGTHPDNRDILNAQPGSSANGPNSVFIVNSNFTPQNANGTAQARAIDLWDVIDLKIVNPQIYALSGPVLYSAEPIRVRESTASRSTGWIEGGWYGSSGYTQEWLLNETARFGRPRKTVFSPNLEMTKGAGDTSSQRYFIRVPLGCGSRVDVNLITRPNAATGTARIVRGLYRGQAGTAFSTTAFDVAYASSVNSVYTATNSSNASMPGTHVEVLITRDEDHANDTLAASLYLQSIEITIYEGRVSAA